MTDSDGAPPPEPPPDAAPRPRQRGWLAARMGWDSRRVVGVDVARGLAMLGMFGAHLHVHHGITPDPGTWLAVVHGRSAILFALLAGVALAIVSGGPEPGGGRATVDLRLRTLVRAVILFALGGLLTLLGTPIAIILEYYAVLFVLAIPLLHWRARGLFVLAGVLAITMPPLAWALRVGSEVADLPITAVTNLLFEGSYAVLVWITYTVLGLAIGRLDLGNPRNLVRLLGIGAGAATVGYATSWTLGWLMYGGFPPIDDVDAGGSGHASWLDGLRHHFPEMITAEPHTESVFEVVGSSGFVVAVLALCLLVTRGRFRYVLLPVAAVGSMALSVYTAHVVAYFWWLEDIRATSSLRYFGWFVLVALVGATVWRLAFGRGPLERAIAAVGRWATRLPVLRPPRRIPVYVESGVAMADDDGVAAWVFEEGLWGRCGQGGHEGAALTALRRQLEETGETRPLRVVERIEGDEQAFARDFSPATDAEREATLAILAETRERTITLLAGCSDAELDWDDPNRTLPTFASWRTLRQLGWHVADTESRYYLPSLGLPSRERADDLLTELRASAEHVRTVLATLPPRLVRETPGDQGTEVWTSTRLLRRLAWHERGELAVMEQLRDHAPQAV